MWNVLALCVCSCNIMHHYQFNFCWKRNTSFYIGFEKKVIKMYRSKKMCNYKLLLIKCALKGLQTKNYRKLEKRKNNLHEHSQYWELDNDTIAASRFLYALKKKKTKKKNHRPNWARSLTWQTSSINKQISAKPWLYHNVD